MIIKDDSVYLDYVKDIETKVNNLFKGIAAIAMSDAERQKIDEIRVKIFGKTSMVRMLVSQKTGLIPNADWIKYKVDIDALYRDLSDKINRVAMCSTRINKNVR